MLRILILALGIFLVPACQSSRGTSEPESTFARILRTQKARACYAVWPPSVVKDPDSGKVSGFLIQTAERIAGQAGFELEYVESSWGGFSADIRTGRCDIGIGAFYALIERSTAVAFTRPFFFAGNNALVRADSPIQSLSEANQKSVRAAVIQGEFSHIASSTYFPAAELIVLEKSSDNTAPLLAVSAGQADVGFMSEDVIDAYVKTHPDTRKLASKSYAMTPISWVTRTEDQALMAFLNNALDYLQTVGELEALARKGGSTFRVRERSIKPL